ncbi:MAG TPA: pitrilysin family protein [Pyrinomonadaceae bacterium]|nr:pitrilysin family protein [Pyrinomonadaceae bacterium]
MKKFFLFSLLAIFFSLADINFAQTGAPTPKTPAVTPKNQTTKSQDAPVIPFVNRVLPNGLEVIVLSDASVPIVTVELAVRNGSFTEPPELSGLSHLYEHMFFKTNRSIMIFRCEQIQGYRRFDLYRQNNCDEHLKYKSEIGDGAYLGEIGNLGITYNGTTREEVVNYYFTTTSPYVSTAIKFINDAVRFPVFDEGEFEREKQVVIGEIDRNESNPYFYLQRNLMDKLFYKYPTRKNALGSRESINTATTEKMRTIQNRYYVPNNSALVVTGDVKPEEVFRIAEQTFGSWKKREKDPFTEFPLVEHPPLAKSEGIIVEQPVNNVLIQIGWHGPSIGKDNPATYAADVFSYILTQPDSRFQRALVDTGLVVAADVTYYTQRNTGPITLTLVTTPEKAKPALAAAYAELAKFTSADYYTGEELANATTLMESRDLFEREKLSEYAHTLSFWWSSTGIDYFRSYHKNMRAVTREEINRYVKTYIQGKPHVGIALISTQSQQEAKLTPEDLIGK